MFGTIKEGRGLRRFPLPGVDKLNDDWSIICTGHNLMQLFRLSG